MAGKLSTKQLAPSGAIDGQVLTWNGTLGLWQPATVQDAQGWANGSYRETLPLGSPFPTAIIWWTDDTKVKKIVQKDIVFVGVLPVTITWSIYGPDGVTVQSQTRDTITYSGVFETSRTRTVI